MDGPSRGGHDDDLYDDHHCGPQHDDQHCDDHIDVNDDDHRSRHHNNIIDNDEYLDVDHHVTDYNDDHHHATDHHHIVDRAPTVIVNHDCGQPSRRPSLTHGVGRAFRSGGGVPRLLPLWRITLQ